MPLGVAGWVAVGTAALGAYSAHKSASAQSDANQAQIDANKQDPRILDMLFGNGGDQGTPGSTGLLDRYRSLFDQPQSAGTKIYGGAGDNYVGNYGAWDMGQMHDAAAKLMAGDTMAPMMDAAYVRAPTPMQAAQSGAAQVNAPPQNRINLTGAYDRFINGDPAQNPYLAGAIQGGIDQSSDAFGAMQRDSTRNLLENILPAIQSGARVSGSYGGNREGLAQGKALDSFATEQQRALDQFGQHNTDAAVGAQAGAFGQGQDRALSAMSGLGAQQYGAASQDASLQEQTNLANQQDQQQAAMAQFEADQQRRMADAGFQQQAGANNQQSKQGTNALNLTSMQTGIGATGGLLSAAYGVAGNQDQYNINRAGQVNGLLQPYLSKNPVPTQLQPVYNNSTGGMLGGAMAGLGIYNGLKQAGAFGGGGSNGGYSPGYDANGNWIG